VLIASGVSSTDTSVQRVVARFTRPCAKPNPDAAREAKCPTCGASAERAEQERRLHTQNAKERKGLITSEQAERDGASQPLVSPQLKWGLGALGFAIMSISALFSTINPRPNNRLLDTTPALGFDVFLPIGVNRAYLYSSDRPDDWGRPEIGYFDSRWTIPLAWWLFFERGNAVWREVETNGNRWHEVKLSAPKCRALRLFAARRLLLLPLLGGGLGEADVDRFVATVAARPGDHLIVDPEEVLGGYSLSDEAHMRAFELALAAVAAGEPSEVVRATREYVGELGASASGWECQVFGYTYA
jgi:hypothetical protein